MINPCNARCKHSCVPSVILCGLICVCSAGCKKNDSPAAGPLGSKSAEVAVMPEICSRSFYWELVLHNDLQTGFKRVFSAEARAGLKSERTTKEILSGYKVLAEAFKNGDPSEADHIRACEF